MQLGVGRFKAKVPSWLIPAAGYAVSIAALVWLLRGVDLDDVLQDFRSLQWGWVVVGVVSDVGVYVVQAWRWNLLLSPVVKAPLWPSIQAIYVGLFSNEILPLRPGEIIRSYLQAHWNKVPFSVAFASAVIERIFDGIWLVIVFFVTAAYFHAYVPDQTLPRWLMDLGKLLGVVVFALSLALAVVMFRKHHAHAVCPETKFGARMRVLIEDLHLMGNSRSFYLAFLASLGYLVLQVLPIYALIRGYDLDLSLAPAFVVLVIWRISTVLPQAPGNIGTSQAALAIGLGLFGVDKTTAAGLSMMTWGVITLPLLLAGFIALALTETNLFDIHHHAKKHGMATHIVATQSPPAK